MSDSRKEFLSEAEDLIQATEDGLLDLRESLPGSPRPDTLNGVFRSMHTLKGLASLFGFRGMADLSHAMETMLDELRLGKRPFDDVTATFLLNNLDLLKTLLEEVSTGNAEITSVESALSDMALFRSEGGGMLSAEKGIEGIPESIVVTDTLDLHGFFPEQIPEIIEAFIDNEPPHLIKITGRVDERVFFGPQLELKTEISTIPGSNRINLKDSVTNRSSSSQEFQLIYHCNYGAPLLEEGSRFVAPVKRVWPINDHSAPLIDKFDVYSGPIRGFVEQVYCIDPLADENGFSTVMLRNRSSDKAVVMTFSLEQLPCLTLWKNTTEIENGYVTGIEPGTSFPYNRRVERGHGRVPELEPGETRTFEIDFTVLDSPAQVADQASQIEKAQAERKPEMFRSPPKVG